MALHVRESFAYDDPHGVSRVFSPGQLVADDDPVVKGREHLFETADENVARRLPAGIEEANSRPIATAEDASNEPGRRRVLTRGKSTKKAAAKKTAAKPEPAKSDSKQETKAETKPEPETGDSKGADE